MRDRGDWLREQVCKAYDDDPWSWETDQPGPRRRRQGPPPWVAGLLGLIQTEPRPRARRGDVRAAVLDVLAGGPLNGYQIISEITERSGGAWRPSPGSVYPTIQQLLDEGLIEAEDDDRGRRTLRLSEAGQGYVEDHHRELAALWRPSAPPDEDTDDLARLGPEVKQLVGAVWQIVTAGTAEQRSAAIDVLIEARRQLYAILGEQPTEPKQDH